MTRTYKHHGADLQGVPYTPGSAVTAGVPTNLGQGLIGYVDGDGAAASEFVGASVFGDVRRADKASATTFSVGDDVIWDASAGQAVPASLTLDIAAGDFYLGTCVVAAVSGDDHVKFIPAPPLDRYNIIRPHVYEFDCATGQGDTDEHILIPAWMNRSGLLIEAVYGIVTEQMAGSSEDQGIITIEDEDDNALSVITAADSAADAVGDVLVGTNSLIAASSGAAAKSVAAGKAVQGFVSQQTAGTPAGKIKVYIRALPLL